MIINEPVTRWRATGPYTLSSLLNPTLLGETRAFLLGYARTGSAAETAQSFVAGELPQRSISSRATFAQTIQLRLFGWKPPAWVLDDLVVFAQGEDPALRLAPALLMHFARQDVLLYDMIQNVIAVRWASYDRVIVRPDVNRFLDQVEGEHPEISRWSSSTRAKLASNVPTMLRDLGLLSGSVHGSRQKQIVEPSISPTVASHLARLLRAEGIGEEDLPMHPDWRVWLWDASRARAAIAASTIEGKAV